MMGLMARVLLAVVIVVGALVAQPASAHHALVSEYDAQQPITLKGKLLEVDWRNPHTFFVLEEERSGGTRWIVGAATPSMLTRFPGGWTRGKVLDRVDELVSITGWKARDGSNRIYGDVLTFGDGQQMRLGNGLGS